MSLFIKLAFLFSIGSMIGWALEVFWRRLFSGNRKWINPGFLTGPCLPLYGFSLCTLYLLAHIDVSFITNPIVEKIILFILMAVAVTVIEYIAGLIFIKGMKVKLWDYSDRWMNINGIICPLFSFFWIILCALYYFFIHPRILSALGWFANHITFSFCIGFFYGVLLVDLIHSLDALNKIKKFAKEKNVIVKYEALKAAIPGRKFLDSLHSERELIFDYLKLYLEKEKEKLEETKEKLGEKIKDIKK
ncbi:MAG: putative ABC transporter permease [Treponemataceae bacterium]